MLKNTKRTLTAALPVFTAIVMSACGITASHFLRREHFAYGATEVNLAYYYDFQWTIDGYNAELLDGNVYRYRYVSGGEWCDYYTASFMETVPNPEWEAWGLESVTTVARSIVDYRSGEEHRIAVLIPSLSSNDYTVVYEGVSATESGEYVAKATLKLNKDDCVFVYDMSRGTAISGRGMSVVINADGTATVTKTWYVAHFDNCLLDRAASIEELEERAYSIPCWTFGSFPQKVAAPRLQHGDEVYGVKGIVEQPDSYWLAVSGFDERIIDVDPLTKDVIWGHDEWKSGEQDTVTFSIVRNGEKICNDQPRKNWNYYINEYTPCGGYTVEFTAKSLMLGEHNSWWNSDIRYGVGTSGMEYGGFAKKYSFEVYPCELLLNDEQLNQYGKDSENSYLVDVKSISDGDFTAIFGVVDGKITFSQCIGLSQVKGSGTYWASEGIAENYFGEAPEITFNVANMNSDRYMPADGDWSAFINKVGEYTVFYRAEMPNYSFDSDGDRYNRFFKIEVTQDGAGGSNSDGTEREGKTELIIVIVCVEAFVIAAVTAFLVFTLLKLRKKH